MKNQYTDVTLSLGNLKNYADRVAGLLSKTDTSQQHSVGIRVRKALAYLDEALAFVDDSHEDYVGRTSDGDRA